MKKLLVSVALSIGLAAPVAATLGAPAYATTPVLGPANYICFNSSGQIVAGATPSTPGVTCKPVNFQPSQGGGRPAPSGGPDRVNQCFGIDANPTGQPLGQPTPFPEGSQGPDGGALNYFQCLTYQGSVSIV